MRSNTNLSVLSCWWAALRSNPVITERIVTVTKFLLLDPFPRPGAPTEPYSLSDADRVHNVAWCEGGLTFVSVAGQREPWLVSLPRDLAVSLRHWPEWPHLITRAG